MLHFSSEQMKRVSIDHNRRQNSPVINHLGEGMEGGVGRKPAYFDQEGG